MIVVNYARIYPFFYFFYPPLEARNAPSLRVNFTCSGHAYCVCALVSTYFNKHCYFIYVLLFLKFKWYLSNKLQTFLIIWHFLPFWLVFLVGFDFLHLIVWFCKVYSKHSLGCLYYIMIGNWINFMKKKSLFKLDF